MTLLDNTLYLSSLWSDMSKLGHFFIALKPNLRSSLSQLSAEELVIAGAQLVAYTVQLENIGLISSASYNLISLISIMQRFMSPVMDVLIVSTGTIMSVWNVLSLQYFPNFCKAKQEVTA